MIVAKELSNPLCAGASISDEAMHRIRREMALRYCKWDPQVGDISTLAPFPLFIGQEDWDQLSSLAIGLTQELFAAEKELLNRPELLRLLGLPGKIRRELADLNRSDLTPAAARVMRFDFHWTSDGWRISEVNSDVPGGFCEASEFPRLIQQACGQGIQTGNPAKAWADAIISRAEGKPVALLAAPGFMEDQQVVSYLARCLRQANVQAQLATPGQIEWLDGRAHLESELGAIIRFYQAEWLPALPKAQWMPLLVGGKTPVANPAVAVLTESKRFPLTWDYLKSSLPIWRDLLPITRDPRDAPWRRDENWLLKTAYCNTGDSVTARDLNTPKQWRIASLSAWLNPGAWVAQRRFETLAISSPLGPIHPCVGVYTIDGQVAGAYTRISNRPVIDYRAMDVALLIRKES